MKTQSQYTLLLISCLSAFFGLSACKDKGPAEKAGQKIDQAAAKVETKIQQTSDKAAVKIQDGKASVKAAADTTEEYLDDSAITAHVKAAILNTAALNASSIEVSTVNGAVSLSGTVDAQESIAKAVEVAKSQKNIKSVHTTLALKPVKE